MNRPAAAPRGPLPMSLDPWRLPEYALRTVLRMGVALIVSLVFTLIVAPVAAKSRQAEKILIPAIDILQSVPVLGFLSITVTGFIALFPGNLFGVESRGARPSLLFKVDAGTGGVIHDAFGAGLDYVEIAPLGGRNEVYGIVVSGGTVYATMSLNDADPHLATLNTASGATTDIGSEGVPLVEGLTTDSTGTLYGLSGSDANDSIVHMVRFQCPRRKVSYALTA